MKTKETYNEFDPKPDEIEDKEKAWLKERAGNFTGSENYNLMKCDRATSKLSWGDPAKLLGFGAPAMGYIFQKAMERRTGFLSNNVKSFNLNYGHENEPLIAEEFEKQTKFYDFKESEFMLSNKVDFLGATPDGKVAIKEGLQRLRVDYGAELKSCVSWDGFRARMGRVMDEKHGDFWQWVTEMHVLNVKKLVFVVAYPMEFKFFEYNIIDASDIHENALIQRVKIANDAIDSFNKANSFIIEPYVKAAIEKYKLNL